MHNREVKAFLTISVSIYANRIRGKGHLEYKEKATYPVMNCLLGFFVLSVSKYIIKLPQVRTLISWEKKQISKCSLFYHLTFRILKVLNVNTFGEVLPCIFSYLANN